VKDPEEAFFPHKRPYLYLYHDQLPHLFNPERGAFHQVRQVISWHREDSALWLDARTDDGRRVALRLDFLSDTVFRLRMAPGAAVPEHTTPCLVEAEWPAPSLQVADEGKSLRLATATFSLLINLDPWGLEVLDRQGRRITAEADDRGGLRHPFSLMLGYRTDQEGRVFPFDSWKLAPDESIYGFGEQFAPLDRRGYTITMWNVDTVTTTTERAYKNVPFYLSSRGYGLFLNSTARITFQVGSVSYVTLAYEVEEPILDAFFFYGPSFKDILYNYTRLTGRPPVVPRWSLGLWVSRATFQNRAEAMTVARRMRAEGIPADLIHLDPDWMHPYHHCDFEWNEEAFPDPTGMLRELKEMGFKVCLWEQPYVPKGTARYAEGAAKGYFVRREDGEPYLIKDYVENETAVVDFTNPQVVAWYQARHRELLAQGVAVFKTDMGEAAPPDGVYFDGTPGSLMHNRYALLYNRAVYEACAGFSKESALVWGRSACAGSQRYPANWGGDSVCRWEDLAAQLWAALGYSLSGFAYWSTDIGGFVGTPSPALYIRWAQFGLLVPMARTHGTSPREPWEYGPEALRIFREVARFRYRLIPYLYALAHEASRTGLPLLRPLVLEFQGDPFAQREGTEYMLGPALLVAPVLDESEERNVYLPAGPWLDWWTGEVYQGPRHISYHAPLDRIPLFLRGDILLPLGEVTQWVGERPLERMELRLFVQREAAFTLYDDNDRPWEYTATRKGERLQVHLPQAPWVHTLAVAGPRPKAVQVDGAPLPAAAWVSADGRTFLPLPADASEVEIILGA